MRSNTVTHVSGSSHDTVAVRTWWAVMVALVLSLVAAPMAFAVDEPLQLTNSEPSTVAELDVPPQEIVLTFNAPVTSVKALVVVEGQKFEDDPTPEGNLVRIPVPPNSPAGEYRVTFDATGEGDKKTSGSLAFTVTAPGSPDSEQPDPGADDPTPGADDATNDPAGEQPGTDESGDQSADEASGGVSSIVWVVVGLLILGVALLILLNSQPRKRAKRRREADADHL